MTIIYIGILIAIISYTMELFIEVKTLFTSVIKPCWHSLPFLLLGFGAFYTGYQTFRQKETAARNWVITLLTAGSIWAFSRGLEYLLVPIQLKMLFNNLQWIGTVLIPPAFFLLSFEFSGKKKPGRLISFFLMVLLPVSMLAAIFTNNTHHFFADNYALIQSEYFTKLDKEYSFISWSFIYYSYFLVAVGIFNLIRLISKPKENTCAFDPANQKIGKRENEQAAVITPQNEYRGLFENAHDAIIISDPISGQILDANARATEMFGYSNDEFNNLKLEAIVSNKEKLKSIFSEISKYKTHNIFELTQFRKDNQSPLSTEVNAGMVIFKGKPAIQSIHRDITLRKNMESRLLHASLHDSLTDLPNRALFLDRLNRVIAHGLRNKEFPFAVLYLDLDRFKDINDTLGHLVGDKLLIGITKRLKSTLRDADTIARIGGDEFAIILDDIHSADSLKELCKRILSNISAAIEVDNNEIIISASIGVVMGTPLYNEPEEYLKDADIALYSAKEHGKARYELFDISMRTSVFNRMKIENFLCKANFKNEFSIAYQPIYALEEQNLIGFEALLRWRQPKVGMISPDEFIPIAENLGIIHNIGYWVLKQACMQLKSWQTYIEKIPYFKLNVNISAVQLLRQDFPEELNAIMAREKVDPKYLALEITETAFINNPELASDQVAKLKSLGIEIQLDDFGTGYSSLSFINLFQVDAIKIERQFISALGQGRQAEMVRAIIALGKNIGLEIIAEGIETHEQLDFLVDGGCKFGQGFYFSQAVIAREAQKLLRSIIKNSRTKNQVSALGLAA